VVAGVHGRAGRLQLAGESAGLVSQGPVGAPHVQLVKDRAGRSDDQPSVDCRGRIGAIGLLAEMDFVTWSSRSRMLVVTRFPARLQLR
jgi:hypothetical protein